MQVLMIPEISSSLAYGSLVAFAVCMGLCAVLYRKEIGQPRLVGGVIAVLLLVNVPLSASLYVRDPCAACAKTSGWFWLISGCWSCG